MRKRIYNGWRLIYHDGTKISDTNSQIEEWNNAPQNNVQILVIYEGGIGHVVGGLDVYNIDEPNAISKNGKQITKDQFEQSRQKMREFHR